MARFGLLNHRAEAKGEAIDCSACHEQSDCLECHKSGFAHEQGSFGNNMINVHRSDFHVTHPIAARTDQNLCSSCHEPKFCSECHDSFRLRSGDIGSPSHRRTFDKGLTGVDIDSVHAGFQHPGVRYLPLARDHGARLPFLVDRSCPRGSPVAGQLSSLPSGWRRLPQVSQRQVGCLRF